VFDHGSLNTVASSLIVGPRQLRLGLRHTRRLIYFGLIINSVQRAFLVEISVRRPENETVAFRGSAMTNLIEDALSWSFAFKLFTYYVALVACCSTNGIKV